MGALNTSKILKNAYKRYILNIGNKRVPTPYRINIPFQPDRRKYGKSGPRKLKKDILEIAAEQNFNLETASVKQVVEFIKANQLGIDCSGFVYHTLDYLLKKKGLGGMKKIGFPPASKTNVSVLASDQFTQKVKRVKDVEPGDIITITKTLDNFSHVLIVIEVKNNDIVYAHSSDSTAEDGVYMGTIKIIEPEKGIEAQDWLAADFIDTKVGDGLRRLKVL